MPLMNGARLGSYEILSPLGAGGMGEVYRARDTTLNRDVAIKMLPDLFASDADRLARFTGEAQTLASLNHPNIAAIYGIEESGDVRALIMELVPPSARRYPAAAQALDTDRPGYQDSMCLVSIRNAAAAVVCRTSALTNVNGREPIRTANNCADAT